MKSFWEAPGHGDSEGPLRAWYTHVNNRTAAWQSWGEVKADFGSASLVGSCVVFNIGGNNYRLVTRILYRSQKVFVLKVMGHKEYDRNKWKGECGCFQPPPTRKTTHSDIQRRRRTR